MNNITYIYVNEKGEVVGLTKEKLEQLFKDEDMVKYNCSIVLMTDGVGNQGTYDSFEKSYNSLTIFK